MNILITGGAGFIGSSLAEKLINNHKLIIIDNFDNSYDVKLKYSNIKKLESHKNCKIITLDIRNKEKLQEVFAENKIDVVVHLAGKSDVRYSQCAPNECIEVNINGTFNLLQFVKEYKIKKVIFASSSSVYGDSNNIYFSEEEKDILPLSIYGITKLSAEKLMEYYAKTYKINIICFRFFSVYGPRQRPNLVIKKFITNILNKQPIEVYGDGSASRDYSYIDDIIGAIISALNYDKTFYEIINIGSGVDTKILDLVRILEKLIGKKAIIQYKEKNDFEMKRTLANISKASLLLDYKPKYTLEEGIKELIKNDFYNL